VKELIQFGITCYRGNPYQFHKVCKHGCAEEKIKARLSIDQLLVIEIESNSGLEYFNKQSD
jgi:hypothetical protein